MRLYPNCKINIGLRVIRRREDGYHDLETIFYPIRALHDILDITLADTFSFEQNGLSVDCPSEDNLLIRCYRRLQALFPQIGNVRIHFEKRIPFGAGLGGGSSDAAHMAIGLNKLFDLQLSSEQLANIVRPLGADCPFFVYNTPCYAEGIGDRLSPIDFPLGGMRLLLLKPAIGISTKEAYSGILCHPEAEGNIIHALSCKTPFRDMKPLLVNDFEPTVFPLHPELAHIKQHLLDAGAVYAGMSGSGSTLFGLFQDDTESSPHAGLGALEKEFAPMILLNDTL